MCNDIVLVEEGDVDQSPTGILKSQIAGTVERKSLVDSQTLFLVKRQLV